MNNINNIKTKTF